MFDFLVEAIAQYPYIGVALIFLVCGIGLPLPEEIVLVAAGYICATSPDKAELPVMMAWCAGAIFAGDLMPYMAGRLFGPRLLRLRTMRLVVTKRRLATFDHWFRRRGDLVIFIARFLAGIRVVAFFTAGTMNMPFRRFFLLDGLGIVLIVPALTYAGYHFAPGIDGLIGYVKQMERGMLIATIALIALGLLWLWRARKRQAYLESVSNPSEAFVEGRPIDPNAPPASATSDDNGPSREGT